MSGAAQTGIGTVRTADARVQGVVAVNGDTATIQSSGTVTAGKATDEVSLSRGGAVRVCAGSTVQLSQAVAGQGRPTASTPVLFALQRGAVEIQTRALKADVVLTPDLRMELSEGAGLDLRLRVNPAGDTCVENLGKDAPMLHVTEQFGSGGYLVKPGQRVMFEHGSVREVVDRERGNCGCPKPNGRDDFPEAVSAGLVAPDVPVARPGETHVQVSTGVDYNGKTGVASGPPAPDGTLPQTTASSAAAPVTAAVPTAQKKSGSGPFAAIGRFFRRLFGGS